MTVIIPGTVIEYQTYDGVRGRDDNKIEVTRGTTRSLVRQNKKGLPETTTTRQTDSGEEGQEGTLGVKCIS